MTRIRNFNKDFDRIIENYGSRDSLISYNDENKKYSYDDLNLKIESTINFFYSCNVNVGDKVGIVLPNSIEMIITFLACLRSGFGFAPIACDSTLAEINSWLRILKPKLICGSHILKDEISDHLHKSKFNYISLKIDGKFNYLKKSNIKSKVAASSKIYLFTSGTTGKPKIIVLDSNRLWTSGYTFARFHNANFNKPFVTWNYLPQSYLGGLFNLTLIPLSVGGTVIVDDVFSGKTYLRFWQTVERFDINVLWLVPSIVRGLIVINERTHRSEKISFKHNIDLALIGTAPIELATKKKFESLFRIELLENYALSETTFISSEIFGQQKHRVESSTGSSLPNVEISFKQNDIVKNNFNEVMVKTPFKMLGYLDELGNLSMPDIDGYFPTGDLGYLNDKGQLILTGRIKEIIKKGGFLISLREIELLVLNHDEVIEAVALSIPHHFYGESYKLILKTKNNNSKQILQNITNFIFSNLAKHKWPEKIETIDEFPKTNSGKIRKYLIK